MRANGSSGHLSPVRAVWFGTVGAALVAGAQAGDRLSLLAVTLVSLYLTASWLVHRAERHGSGSHVAVAAEPGPAPVAPVAPGHG